MTDKTVKEPSGFETWLIIGGAVAVVFFLAFMAFMLVLPMNNYLQAGGTVQFRGEQTVVSEVDGVVTEIYQADHGRVRRSQPIIKVVDEERQGNAGVLQARIRLLETQMERLSRLESAGALDGLPVEAKRLELSQAREELSLLRRTAVVSGAEGFFYFQNPPETLLGTYVRKGDIVGYTYESPEKEVDVALPASLVDRFDPRMVVRVNYRNPVSYLSRNVPAAIKTIHANKQDNRLRIICRMLAAPDSLADFRPGNVVTVSFLVGRKSLFEDLFGIEPAVFARAHLPGWSPLK